ncbi:PilN domain-containing protein [Mitsuaria sp. WAJ17]|uniref:PilN domain-containing protein n=1 Tax=Mitsuaria sp. WAJ17 TaxID=2761452 RepID=UPI0016011966|nr:PilN domain-containing protein [Mitsuaria sp. WAJ17]MBB2486428.1 PilN domain-containing protein [Mitsuaria sp. WAJ17]
MAQQINLLTPILLKPRRHFTATAMAQALGLILVGSLLLAGWIQGRSEQRRAEFRQRQQALQAEQQALSRSLAGLPATTDIKALEAQIKVLKEQQQGQAELLQSLRSGHQVAGERHSDLLALIAGTVPASVWLQGLRWQSGQLEISGGTLDPAALRAWLVQLQGQALLHRLALADVRLEMISSAQAGSAGTPAPAARLQLPAGAGGAALPVWAFQVRGVEPGLKLAAGKAIGGGQP